MAGKRRLERLGAGSIAERRSSRARLEELEDSMDEPGTAAPAEERATDALQETRYTQPGRQHKTQRGGGDSAVQFMHESSVFLKGESRSAARCATIFFFW